MSIPKQPLIHGTRHGYANHGCRCQPCTEANAAYGREKYRAAAGSSYVPRGDSPHRANDSVFGAGARIEAPDYSWWCVPDEAFMRERDAQLPRLIGVRQKEGA